MSDIVNKVFNGGKINQESYEAWTAEAFGKIKNPTPEQVEMYEKSVRGGNCSTCGKPWLIRRNQTIVADYTYYEPMCKCLEAAEKKRRKSQIEADIADKAGIPEKYTHVHISDMSRQGLKPETIEAINRIEERVKAEAYKSTGLFICGDNGVGKTHITVSVLRHLAVKYGMRIKFVDCANILSDEIKAGDYIKILCEYDAVLLDDFDKLRDTKRGDWGNERIFALINGLDSRKRIIIGTANYRDEKEMTTGMDGAIISRIRGCCDVVFLYGYDYRLRGKDAE